MNFVLVVTPQDDDAEAVSQGEQTGGDTGLCDGARAQGEEEEGEVFSEAGEGFHKGETHSGLSRSEENALDPSLWENVRKKQSDAASPHFNKMQTDPCISSSARETHSRASALVKDLPFGLNVAGEKDVTRTPDQPVASASGSGDADPHVVFHLDSDSLDSGSPGSPDPPDAQGPDQACPQTLEDPRLSSDQGGMSEDREKPDGEGLLSEDPIPNGLLEKGGRDGNSLTESKGNSACDAQEGTAGDASQDGARTCNLYVGQQESSDTGVEPSGGGNS